MSRYKVNLSASFELETNDEAEARYHAIRLLEKDIWGNIEVASVQKLTSEADNSGLNGEINLDKIIFSEIDEDDSDVECLYQTWKKIMKTSIDECIKLNREVYKDRIRK